MKKNKNNNSSDEKVDKKKTILSLIVMFLLIISSSFFFQSCDPTIINEENSDLLDQFISDIDNENEEESLNEENKEESALEDVSYFILNLVDEINNNNIDWVIESPDTNLIPTSFSVFEFNEERMYGWTNLDGFEDDIKNGFCYFEVDQNVMLLSSDDNSFLASIDFNQSWQDGEKTYSKLIFNNQEVLCYCIMN